MTWHYPCIASGCWVSEDRQYRHFGRSWFR